MTGSNQSDSAKAPTDGKEGYEKPVVEDLSGRPFMVQCTGCGWEGELEECGAVDMTSLGVVDASGEPVPKKLRRCPDCGNAVRSKIRFVRGLEVGRTVTCAEGCGWRGVDSDCPEREVWSGLGEPGPRMSRRCPECGGGIKAEGVATVHSAEMR